MSMKVRALQPVCDEAATAARGRSAACTHFSCSYMDAALADAASARRELADAEREADLLEARALLSITGANAETRKAALAVALSESITYQDITAEVRALRERLTDAERRAEIARQRVRLHRAAVAVALGTQDA